MRAVFDTNVLISAAFFGGLPRLALEFAIKGELTLFTSSALMDELDRILKSKFSAELESADAFWREYQQLATLVKPKRKLSKIVRDPSDNRVLECAVEAKADVIVSGDHHLLDLKMFRSIPIITVRQFVDILHKS